jgi:undecaprenyl-diphosphatase
MDSDSKKVFTMKIISISVYFILVFGLEQVYRQPLFDYSVKWEKEWQTSTNLKLLSFFKVITEFGTLGVIIPLIIIFFLWFPINKSYTFLSVVIYSVFFDNLLKMIYGSPRPFWIDPSLAQACDGGFGNPSGHAFSSSAIYLTLWHLLITQVSYFKKFVVRVILLCLFLGLIIAILLSRLYLGVHGINQILHGSLLGTGFYYLYMNIFTIHNMEGKQFFAFIRNTSYIIYFSCKYIIWIALSLLLYFLTDNDPSQWTANINQVCPNLQSWRKFNNDGLFGALTIFALIGAYYAIVTLAYVVKDIYVDKEDAINKWYIGGLKQNLVKIGFTLLFATPIILNFALPSSMNLALVYIFKIALPYLLTMFGLYFCTIYVCIKTGYANPEIYEGYCAKSDSGNKLEQV